MNSEEINLAISHSNTSIFCWNAINLHLFAMVLSTTVRSLKYWFSTLLSTPPVQTNHSIFTSQKRKIYFNGKQILSISTPSTTTSWSLTAPYFPGNHNNIGKDSSKPNRSMESLFKTEQAPQLYSEYSGQSRLLATIVAFKNWWLL